MKKTVLLVFAVAFIATASVVDADCFTCSSSGSPQCVTVGWWGGLFGQEAYPICEETVWCPGINCIEICRLSGIRCSFWDVIL